MVEVITDPEEVGLHRGLLGPLEYDLWVARPDEVGLCENVRSHTGVFGTSATYRC